MNIEKHISNLKQYIKDDEIIEKDGSDFANFCKGHIDDIQAVLNELEKKDTVISEYEKECRQFKSFCKRVRRDEKRDVDEFNQGQELKCNQFLNLLYGEAHWSYEGKYFDETDKQVDKLFKKAEEK